MQSRALITSCLITAAALGCDGAGAPTPDDAGVLELALASPGELLGGSWQLADATFTIKDAATGETVDTFTDAGEGVVLRARLDPGAYTVELGGPWFLVRIVGALSEVVDVEAVENTPIAFTVEAGRATQVTYHFRVKRKGSVNLGIEMTDSLPVMTADFVFDSVDESTPWLEELVGKHLVFTWELDSIHVTHEDYANGTFTMVFGDTSTVTLDPATPSLLVDLLSAHDAPSPTMGPVEPYYRLFTYAGVGRIEQFADVWGYDVMSCYIDIRAEPGVTFPIDDDGYAALVPFSAGDAVIGIGCAEGDDLHEVFGRGVFDVQ